MIFQRFFILIAAIIISSCNSKLQNKENQISNLCITDSVVIKEDSLILDEGGITNLAELNDSIAIVCIDGSKVYLLNLNTGIFIKKLETPNLILSHFLDNTSWNVIYPDYELIEIIKGKADWIENVYYNFKEKTIYLYFAPFFRFKNKVDSKFQSPRQTVILSYDENYNYKDYFFLPDLVPECDTCFPGMNYSMIFDENNTITTLNINLNYDIKKYANKPLLLHYSFFKNTLQLDSVSSIYKYKSSTDYNHIFSFSSCFDKKTNENYFCDGLNIFKKNIKQTLYTLDTIQFPNSVIEKFAVQENYFLISILQSNSKRKYNNFLYNTFSKSIQRFDQKYSPVLFHQNQLIYIDKNSSDENYKIYKCNY